MAVSHLYPANPRLIPSSRPCRGISLTKVVFGEVDACTTRLPVCRGTRALDRTCLQTRLMVCSSESCGESKCYFRFRNRRQSHELPRDQAGEAPIGRLHLQLEDAASIQARFPAPFTSSSSNCRLTLHCWHRRIAAHRSA